VSAKGEVEVVELTPARQSHARRVAEARATIPDFEVTAALENGNAPGPSPAALIHAASRALRAHPRANSSYRDGRLEVYSRVNVSFAVFSEDGAVHPTIFDADAKSLGDIAGEIDALADRVREGTITSPEVSGATFSVTAVEIPGFARLASILQPPHVAALAATGSTLTLSCDARVLLPPEAVDLLTSIRGALE